MQSITTQPVSRSVAGALIVGSLGLIVLLIILVVLSGGTSALTLFIPAFLAGVLSFLSPCTLPVLPAYFAWTLSINNTDDVPLETRQWRTLLSSVAFFAGLATTMVVLGVVLAQTFGRFVAQHLDTFTRVGGAVIIGLGLLSLFGKGFAGPTLKRSHSSSLGGAYLYGLTFAVGWTACIGPILGTILTMLIASGASAVAGGVLTFVYVLGLGLPLMIVATFFNRFGQGSAGWRWLRGRMWEVQLGSRTFYLHSTNILSGVLLVFIGILLFQGALSSLNQYALPGGVTQWANDVQYSIQDWFGLN